MRRPRRGEQDEKIEDILGRRKDFPRACRGRRLVYSGIRRQSQAEGVGVGGM